MLDEREYRREPFDEANSVAVDFPGGTFLLPKPVVYLRPVFAGGKRADQARLCTDDPEFDRLKAAVSDAAGDDEADFSGAMIDVAAHMLLEAYDLDDDTLGRVFAIREDGDGVSVSWWADVMAVAHGRAPKASPAT